MANIMQQLQLKNKPTRSGFDLGRSIKFTAKTGEATPVGPVKVVFPGSTHKLGLKSFTRTVSVNTAAFARLREYYDFYFVPFEVLWNKFDSVITQMKDNCQHAMGPIYDDNLPLSLDLPYFTCESVVKYLKALKGSQYDLNCFGFKRSFNTVRLLSYLGYPDFSPYLQDEFTWEKYPMPNKRLSPFPLLAYQKVYADHIRYSQWEKSNPSTFNLDYISGQSTGEIDIAGHLSQMIKEYNFFDLRYFNYNKDLFFGLLPNVQYGDSALVSTSSVTATGTLNLRDFKLYGKPNTGGQFEEGTVLAFGGQPSGDMKSVYGSYNESANESLFSIFNAGGITVNDVKSNFSILALRQAEALQRWKEVSQSVDQDYKSQVEAHFGVKVSDYLAHKSTWLNGYYNSLDINPVVNTNLQGDNAADIKGYGTMNTNGQFTFNSQDRYGIIICLYHVAPIFDYMCGYTDPSVYLSHATDFPLPEFDRIGMEPVYMQDLIFSPYTATGPTQGKWGGTNLMPGLMEKAMYQDEILGYAPRYIKWKTSVDIALGGFTKTEKSWVLPFTYTSLFQALSNDGQNLVNLSFVSDSFRINPRVVDTIFSFAADSDYETDHYRVNCMIMDDVVLPLDYNGLPY